MPAGGDHFENSASVRLADSKFSLADPPARVAKFTWNNMSPPSAENFGTATLDGRGRRVKRQAGTPGIDSRAVQLETTIRPTGRCEGGSHRLPK
jgi:hypothetical protein